MDKTAAVQAYRSSEASDASPVRTVAILYDRAIEALNQAIRGTETNDIDLRWRNNKKAMEIIMALANALDHDNGGEIAQNLDRLYGFMVMHLGKVDLKNDPQPARDVIGLLEPLRRSWHELADKIEKDPNFALEVDNSMRAALSGQAPIEAPKVATKAVDPQAAAYGAAPAAKTEGVRITL